MTMYIFGNPTTSGIGILRQFGRIPLLFTRKSGLTTGGGFGHELGRWDVFGDDSRQITTYNS